ncbi:MAG: UvrD-helicase domain-containing protein [Deltaproteobacteria bacterium]|nr:UvrD-helicase domain-containing protein [Deltaproteobacteria bacterium]
MTEPVKEIADGREREAALDPARSFIVQAPAGSGKTELLMQRFLALLAAVKRPEEILAMTFTRKAAAGMRNRILDAMAAAAEGASPASPNERVTFALARAALERSASLGWDILANPGRLKIQTIDSFCASVVAAAPVLSKTGGRLAISANPEELYHEAAARTVEMLDGNGPEAGVVLSGLRHMDNSVEALTDRIVVMLERRDQWLRHVNTKDASFDEGLRAGLEAAIGRLVETRLMRVAAAFPSELDDWLLGSARFAASNLGDDSPVKRLANLTSMPGASSDALPLWQALAALLLTDKGELRKPVGVNVRNGFPADKAAAGDKKAFKELLSEFETKGEFLTELARVKALPTPRYDEWEWEMLLALARLLPVAVRCLKDVFAERGEADFIEIASAAIEALGSPDSPSETLLALDLRLSHILVDEYQDTSYTQLKLLRLLTSGWEPSDGRTLFVVGDPMQSIFLWREAQVGLFLEARQSGINGVRLTPLTLRTNFRSHAQIIDWVNETFAPVFPSVEDVFTGAVRYEPSVAHKEALSKGEPVLRLFDGRSDGAEAAEVASILKGIGRDESCAVLCRSRSHLAVIVETLKAEGVAFRAREFDPLGERVVVQDLFALLRFLLHPYDRTAGLAVLRAPWCGLALSDMHSLCLGGADTPVWTLINDEARIAGLSGDGQARLALVRSKLATGLDNRGRVAMRSLLEGLWIGLGGPACLADASAMADAQAFFDVVGSVGVGGRLDPLKSIEGRIEKLYADTGGIDTNIELMTLHKAKGLEFDHVLMPGLGRPPRRDDKKLLIWMERGDDILLAPVEKRRGGNPSPLYDYLKDVTREKMRLEAARLFYVGATRARRYLYLFGHVETGPELRAVGLAACVRANRKSGLDNRGKRPGRA